MRFFCITKDSALAAEAHREAQVDFCRTVGLLALAGSDDQIVGHAFYTETRQGVAEVAFTIANNYQGRGLASILLGQLSEIAVANGIQEFEAEVAAANHAMLRVFRESGFHLSVQADAGQLQVTFPTSLSAEAAYKFEHRESTAAVNALRLFFEPRAVAVVGASRNRGTIAGEVFHNLISYPFRGAVYPVNPAAEVIQGVPAYSSVEKIPEAIDLAVIVVPAPHVLDVAKSCARKGVKALVVVSAGFSETGKEGQALQAELVQVCRSSGMRLIGPNCMAFSMLIQSATRCDLRASCVRRQVAWVFFQSGALGLPSSITQIRWALESQPLFPWVTRLIFRATTYSVIGKLMLEQT